MEAFLLDTKIRKIPFVVLEIISDRNVLYGFSFEQYKYATKDKK